jgi:hypothetical protein
MKTYPLEIEELREFEGGHMGWWSKGHHDPTDFLSYASLVAGEILDVDVRFVRHEWWRCVPIGVAGEHFTLTVAAKPGARGAFPVTVVE